MRAHHTDGTVLVEVNNYVTSYVVHFPTPAKTYQHEHDIIHTQTPVHIFPSKEPVCLSANQSVNERYHTAIHAGTRVNSLGVGWEIYYHTAAVKTGKKNCTKILR